MNLYRVRVRQTEIFVINVEAESEEDAKQAAVGEVELSGSEELAQHFDGVENLEAFEVELVEGDPDDADEAATALHDEIEAGGDEFQDALDELVIEEASAEACGVNNDGPSVQIQCLLENGWTVESLRERLGLKAPGQQ